MLYFSTLFQLCLFYKIGVKKVVHANDIQASIRFFGINCKIMNKDNNRKYINSYCLLMDVQELYLKESP